MRCRSKGECENAARARVRAAQARSAQSDAVLQAGLLPRAKRAMKENALSPKRRHASAATGMTLPRPVHDTTPTIDCANPAIRVRARDKARGARHDAHAACAMPRYARASFAR